MLCYYKKCLLLTLNIQMSCGQSFNKRKVIKIIFREPCAQKAPENVLTNYFINYCERVFLTEVAVDKCSIVKLFCKISSVLLFCKVLRVFRLQVYIYCVQLFCKISHKICVNFSEKCFYRSSHPRRSVKQMLLKISQISRENI